MKIALLLVLSGIPFLTPTVAHAQIVAVQSAPANLAPGTHSSFNEGLTLGWKFTVGSSSLSVTDLGYFDSAGDGLVDVHEVGIWEEGGGSSPIINATLAAGTGGILLNSYRFTSVAPTTLNAGQSYFIGGWSSAANDKIIAGVAGETIASQITFINAAYNGTSGFLAPNVTYANNFGNFGPNFQFTEVSPVPEPHEYALITGVGLLGFVILRKRIARQRTQPAAA